jgi:hypothetical protein
MTNKSWKDSFRGLTFKEKSEFLVSWVGVFSLIIGGIYGIIQIQNNTSQRKASATLSLITLYFSSSLNDAFGKIQESIVNQKDQLQIVNFEFLKDPRKEENIKIRDDFFSKLIKDSKLEKDVKLVKDFFVNVTVCASVEQCDTRLICQFLGEDMHTFEDNFKGYFSQLEKDGIDYEILKPISKFYDEECRELLNANKKPFCFFDFFKF